jgi:sterol 3beta-glucosyltransferase
MKVLIITCGTEGDVRPLAALGAALRGAGHEATLLAPEDGLEAARAMGAAAIGLPGAVRAALNAAGTTGDANSAATLARLVNVEASPWLKLALNHGAGCDIVLAGGLAAFIGLSAAEKLGVPGVGAGMFPLTATADFASPFIAPGVTPRWANRLSFDLINGLVWRSLAKATNAARAGAGLPIRRRVWTEHHTLYGFSRHLVPRPADWPDNATICGFWSPAAAKFSPPAPLAEFLAGGEAPIYVGFGSMTAARPRPFLEALTVAIGGRRALFHPGWSGIGAGDLPANFHVIGPTPHDWLFPRTAMAIHHGGSGTSHAAARAGVPSIVAPFGGDQRFWADRLARAGVAPSWISVRRPDAGAIARAVEFGDRDETRRRAKALGAEMAGEDGLAAGVAALEGLAEKRSYA